MTLFIVLFCQAVNANRLGYQLQVTRALNNLGRPDIVSVQEVESGGAWRGEQTNLMSGLIVEQDDSDKEK